ncbi:bestrophin-like domain [Paraburkholderia metrosideri]|jgi:hypothetical protein|uniref:DUF4239 domain-containing protein n=1 Tax=Paraburkholderia metrosideri TaxID=580937 RepID=A0ABM8P8R7_9BURK|nr:hypothetical protein [Paraburkholderia metrosideri]CAD6559362.1 hypothetical protein LMG28140_06610 [Paraburkholderia metrosideri]
MQDLIRHPIILFFVALILMSLAGWIGSSIVRSRMPLHESAKDDYKLVQSATLTLLALMIGFSLSMAVGRYDQRKNYEEEEANAIGTEFLRADLLPAAQGTAIRSLLAQYLHLRIEFYQTRDTQRVEQIDTATAELESRLWTAAKDGALAQPTPVTALAVAGMNDVINTQGYTQAAWWNRVPVAAWILMIVIGVFSNGLIGYGAEISKGRNRLLLIMPITVSLSFMLIADIDSPRNGIIRVVPQNLISTAQSLHNP